MSVAQTGVSYDAPQTVSVSSPYRDVVRVAWHDHTPELSSVRAGSNAQARAPPLSV